MIFFNGNIITMTDHREKPQAVVVEKGIITEVIRGELPKEVLSSQKHRLIDLKGKTLMPSFIDAHSHFTSVATSFLEVSLAGAESIQEILERLRDYIVRENKAEGSWIVAKGYDQNFLKEKRYPTAEEIDKAAPKNPVVLHHCSGHMGVFNTAAAKLLNIDPKTGKAENTNNKRDQSGFSGYLEENDFLRYSEKVPVPSIEDMKPAYKKAQQKYASYGITTIQEGMTIDELIPMYGMLSSSNSLYLDVVCFCGIEKGSRFIKTFSDSIGGYKNHIKIGGYKIFLDGSPQGRTAWMRKPYKGEQNYFGHSSMSDEEVFSALKTAAENGRQIIAHCNGDRAVQQLLECAQKAEAQGFCLEKIRPVIIHGQLMGKDQIKTAKDLGFMASFFPVHIANWGEVHIKNFGIERASHISPAASAEKEGLVYTFHQDSPVTEPDMLKTIWCAVERKMPDNRVLGPEERISVYSALKAVTANPAYQYFEEAEKGTIEKGKKADLVVLDENPLDCESQKLPNIGVIAAFKEGREIYSAQKSESKN